MSDPAAGDSADGFATSRQGFEVIVSFLENEGTMALAHGELEGQLERQGRDLFRQLFQDHLTLRAEREERLDTVVDAASVGRGHVETGHVRTLATVFGDVEVRRMAYRKKGHENLHPADASLNLPQEKHSHGLRLWSAVESSRGSFDAAVDAIARATGQKVGKRQVESLAALSSVDIDAFYAERSAAVSDPDDVLVSSVDGKGIVMRPEALREATRRVAQSSATKLKGRLSKGEKRGRKRMAELGAVYDVTPVVRRSTDIFASGDEPRAKAPAAKNKWLTASVVKDAAPVIAEVFDEAERRDALHQRTWVALVDGNSHQIDRIETEAEERKVDVTIVIDLIHVLEYLWKAAWCFFSEGDSAAEQWVRDRGICLLDGGARDVAAGIRRRATSERLKSSARMGADASADYLTNKADYLDYPTALAQGWPIATGIIEGACRHIVADRMDLTGARWSLEGAETVLKLRALRSNGDFDAYWRFHLLREHERVHRSRYADNVIPKAA